jgi:hypothetical protein
MEIRTSPLGLGRRLLVRLRFQTLHPQAGGAPDAPLLDP